MMYASDKASSCMIYYIPTLIICDVSSSCACLFEMSCLFDVVVRHNQQLIALNSAALTCCSIRPTTTDEIQGLVLFKLHKIW